MTFQQNSFRPITLLFEVNFTIFHRNGHHIEMCRVQHLGCYLEGQGHTLQQSCVWPKTLSDFTTTFDKLLLCVQYLFREHYPVLTGSCFQFGGDFNSSTL